MSLVQLVEAELNLFGGVVKSSSRHEVCLEEDFLDEGWEAYILSFSAYQRAVCASGGRGVGVRVTPAFNAHAPRDSVVLAFVGGVMLLWPDDDDVLWLE